MRLEVKVDTTLLADALNRPIHEGDLVLTDAGRIYFVEFTENSFLRQGFLRVKEARKSRTQILPAEQHAYVEGQFSLVVQPEKVELDPRDRRDYYREVTKLVNEARVKELQERRSLRRRDD
jgi:hypothetical protein